MPDSLPDYPAYSPERSFPPGFMWGCATSAYQVEGSPDADGKGPSIWDVYSHTPGRIIDGSTGDVANDHYRRYRDDVKLIKESGSKAYRFSISWPRVFPEGTGSANQNGLDFYSRLVDELLASGITPFATLYHWDLPQALQERVGGWQSRETAKAFADYAGYVASKLSDRVGHFITTNELHCVADMGYSCEEIEVLGKKVLQQLAPGLRLPAKDLNQVRHHVVLAHGLAVRAIRANAKAGTRCGPAENILTAVPLVNTKANVAAAEQATRELNAPYLTVMLEGKYTDAYLVACGADAPDFSDEDLKAISEPVDFVGINVYRPAAYVIATDDAPGYREVPFNTSHPKMLSPWHLVGPEVMYWGPRFCHALWKPKEIYITENGCAASDEPSSDGIVYDTDRIMFFRASLNELQRATAEGIPVKGYFLWTLMDNFEWGMGFTTRFGIYHVDFTTQTRTPKMSAEFYRQTTQRNAVA